MKERFRKLLRVLTFPLSTSKEKMNEEYNTLDLIVVWMMGYSVLCVIAYALNRNLLESAGNILLAVEFLACMAVFGIIHISLELLGNYRRARVRKNLNK